MLVITRPGKSLLTPWPFGFPILLAAGRVHLDGLRLKSIKAQLSGPGPARQGPEAAAARWISCYLWAGCPTYPLVMTNIAIENGDFP
jgi:hypothetical protein